MADGDAHRPAIDFPRWWDPYDAELVADRSRVQIDLISQAFEEAGVPLGIDRAPDGTANYLYRPGALLTRDVDVPRVYEALGIERSREKDSEEYPLQTAGLHIVRLQDDRPVPDVIADLDRRLGVGVVTPDHALHVCAVTWCSVMEPQPVSERACFPGNSEPDADGHLGRVVVVDTGGLEQVIAEHGWLEGVTSEEEKPSVGHYTGHGTFIAGVVRTWAPAADVHIEGVTSIGGAAFESDVVAGLMDALDKTPDVISMSAGTRTREDLPLLSFEVFWEERLQHLKGTILVAAAGNDADRGPFWPAAFPWVVSVGALDADGRSRAGYSCYGSWVDVHALGTEVVNAFPRIDYTYREPPQEGQTADFPEGLAAWSGTSFAAPMVAGLTVARMTWSGQSAADAVQSILAHARLRAGVGVGARLNDASSALRA